MALTACNMRTINYPEVPFSVNVPPAALLPSPVQESAPEMLTRTDFSSSEIHLKDS